MTDYFTKAGAGPRPMLEVDRPPPATETTSFEERAQGAASRIVKDRRLEMAARSRAEHRRKHKAGMRRVRRAEKRALAHMVAPCARVLEVAQWATMCVQSEDE